MRPAAPRYLHLCVVGGGGGASRWRPHLSDRGVVRAWLRVWGGRLLRPGIVREEKKRNLTGEVGRSKSLGIEAGEVVDGVETTPVRYPSISDSILPAAVPNSSLHYGTREIHTWLCMGGPCRGCNTVVASMASTSHPHLPIQLPTALHSDSADRTTSPCPTIA